MDHKICNKCGLDKPLIEYYNAAKNSSGKQSSCKKCVNARKTENLRRKSAEAGSTKQLTLVARELRDQGLKRCSDCKVVKSMEYFHNHKNTTDGKAQNCAECAQKTSAKYYTPEYGSARYQRNKDRLKNNSLLRDFGITLEQYRAMFDQQKGLCAVCDRPSPDKALAVDHDHVTGEVRRLLCGNCNVAVGFVQESPRIAIRIADYLESYGKK